MTIRQYGEVLDDIVTHPGEHHHSNLNALSACCLVAHKPGGEVAIDLRLIDAHSALVPLGTNGGRNCDVLTGPCSCGAWH